MLVLDVDVGEAPKEGANAQDLPRRSARIHTFCHRPGAVQAAAGAFLLRQMRAMAAETAQ